MLKQIPFPASLFNKYKKTLQFQDFPLSTNRCWNNPIGTNVFSFFSDLKNILKNLQILKVLSISVVSYQYKRSYWNKAISLNSPNRTSFLYSLSKECKKEKNSSFWRFSLYPLSLSTICYQFKQTSWNIHLFLSPDSPKDYKKREKV